MKKTLTTSGFTSVAAVGLAVCLMGPVLLWPANLAAQATVSPPNTIDVGLAFQYGYARGVFFEGLTTGDRPTFEGTTLRRSERHHSFVVKLNAEYATPLPGLAINMSLPMTIAFEDGDSNFFWHPGTTCEVAPSSPLSGGEGCTHDHAGFLPTDLTLGARYLLPIQPLGVRIAPSIATSFPIADYPVWGHDAYGTGLATLSLGFDIGRDLSPLLEELFIDFGYKYTFSESIYGRINADLERGLPEGPYSDLDVRKAADAMPGEFAQPNRSDLYVRAGYFIHPTLTVTAGVNIRIGHGGFTWSSLDQIMEALPVFTYYHDPLARTTFALANVSVAWSITDWLSIYGTGFYTFAGSSTMPLSGAEVGISSSIYLPDMFGDDDEFEDFDDEEDDEAWVDPAGEDPEGEAPADAAPADATPADDAPADAAPAEGPAEVSEGDPAAPADPDSAPRP